MGKDLFVTVRADWIHLSSKRGELPTPGESDQQTASLVFDVDNNGLNDFVIGARDVPPSMVWFRRLAYGWERHVIDAELLPIEAGGAYYDIDGDGDTDIVMGEDSSGNKVYWWENPYPDVGRAWKRYVIKGSGANKHHDQMFVDIDGDEKAELVFWNQGANTLFFAEVPADPKRTQPWPYLPIFVSLSESEGLAQADIDGDGKTDLVAGGRWFKYMGGTTFVPEVIDDGMRFSRAAAGQLKNGGWAEAVLVVGDGIGRLKWYEWDGQSWLGHDLLGVDVIHGHSLQIADINKDGNLDIFCAEMHTPGHKIKATAWIFYGDGKGHFDKEVISTGLGNHESRVADLDGDGDKDLLIKPYTWDAPRVDVLLNRRANFDRWERHVVDGERPGRAVFIDGVDVNGDELKDIVTGAWWYRNPGELASQWERRGIGDPLYNMAAVYDFDADGDVDI
ncbi:MAG: FG-GAP repeat domain-containing protein, partial [Pyrinomonadaceae bacterium]